MTSGEERPTVDTRPGADLPTTAVEEALRLARAVDRGCSEEAVREFMMGIAEADKALRAAVPSGPPSVVPFDASWSDEGDR
jgi:hypothetical protein